MDTQTVEKKIDCFFVGYNEISFNKHVSAIKAMGTNSGAYRDLELDFIYYENEPYCLPDIINKFQKEYKGDQFIPFSFGNEFSLTNAFLCTYIHKQGLSFDYINSFQEEKEYLKKHLLENDINAIAIPTTLYVTPLPIHEVVEFIRKYNKTVPIIMGGPFISSQFQEKTELARNYILTKLNADFYINCARGEQCLTKILKYIRDGKKTYGDIPNLCYKEGKNFICNESIPEHNEMCDNTVDWRLFEDRLPSMINLRTSISCPFRCSYCEYPKFAGKYEPFPVEELEKELDSVYATGKVKRIMFVDDTFNVPPERFKEVLRMMIRKKYNFKWNSFFRCQFADDEMVRLMKESGCEGVYLGIESGSDMILKNMNKNVTVDKYLKGISYLKKYNINILMSTLVGFPGETKETVQATFDLIEKVKPDFLRIHLWFCSQIVDIWNKRDEFGIKGSQFEWVHNTMNTEEACDNIRYIFDNVKGTNYIPQYNFDFLGVINLLNRGMELDKIKELISYFNQGVREKEGKEKNASEEIISNIRRLCEF